MTGIQPYLWVDGASAAVAFYVVAFGARVLHQVGEGDDSGLAGARVMSWPARNDSSLSCRTQGSLDVCTQGEEWRPMPQAIWPFRLVRLAGPPGVVRFDYVVAPLPSQA